MNTKKYNELTCVVDKLNYDATKKRDAVNIRADQDRLKKIIKKFKNNINSANHRPARSEYEKRRRLYNYKEQLKQAELKKIDDKEGSPRQILGLDLESNKFKKLGTWFYIVVDDLYYLNNYYSKRWHRLHGGKPVHSRSIKFGRMHRNKIQLHKLELNNFAGNFVLRAAKKLQLFNDVKNSKYTLSVRLDPIFDAKLVEKNKDYKIYKRTLEGVIYDYVIVDVNENTTYHDSNYNNLKNGLAAKQAAKKDVLKKSELINIERCKKLGFCNDGINSFCDLFNLNINETYNANALKNIINNSKISAHRFENELKTLAKSVSKNFSFFD